MISIKALLNEDKKIQGKGFVMYGSSRQDDVTIRVRFQSPAVFERVKNNFKVKQFEGFLSNKDNYTMQDNRFGLGFNYSEKNQALVIRLLPSEDYSQAALLRLMGALGRVIDARI